MTINVFERNIMSHRDPYSSPESNVEKEGIKERRETTMGRRVYVINLFLIWVVLPLLAGYLFKAIGIDEIGALKKITTFKDGSQVGVRFFLDSLYVWYISIPLFIYCTFRRVQDTRLSPWFTLLFILPVINIAIWFWSPKYK